MKSYLSLGVVAGLVDVAVAGICSALVPGTWTQAAQANPQLKGALDELSQHAIATWYTDRFDDVVSELLSKCNGETPSIVIYGLPGKDCADGFSSSGKNKDAAMYKSWIQNLVTRVGTREVVYVLEPDAIGLLANKKCSNDPGYLNNMKTALGLITSGNPNAKVYVDVAGWAIRDEAAKILNDLKSAGKLNGITINTSNYKTNAELMSTCEYYSAATKGLHCVFDTSRNYRGSKSDEWCNSASAGIGAPPGTNTGSSLVDYNLWLKVPGESDGICNGRTPDAMIGPNAGDFFVAGFTSLWNNGYFVDQKGLPKIGGNWPAPGPKPSPSSKPTVAPSTDAPYTDAPTTTAASSTSAPTTTSESTPEPTTTNSSTPEPTSSTLEPTSQPTEEPATESPAYESTSTNAPTTSQAAKDISVQSSTDEDSGISPTMAILIGAVAVAAVVATVLAVMVIRKRNLDEKRNDYIERDSRGIVVLGNTPHRGLDTERALQVL